MVVELWYNPCTMKRKPPQKPAKTIPTVVQQAATTPVPEQPLKLDLGCGPNKKPGFTGVDSRKFPGVDVVHDLTAFPWPFADKSVDEVHASHFVEHLNFNSQSNERVKFFNELHRVMKPGAKALIITPHWASERAMGDFTHADKPVTEMMYYYLDRNWRRAQAPHCDRDWNPSGFTCHFPGTTWGYTLRPDLQSRNIEYQTYALQNYKAAAQDLVATLTRGEDEVAQ